MQMIRIVNWDKYQHYHMSDGSQPKAIKNGMVWFKMYTSCLQDSSFIELSPALKWTFIGLMCLACKTKNETEYNQKWLQRALNVRGIEKKVSYLIAIGFIEIFYKNSIPDKIREEERRKEEIRLKTDEKIEKPISHEIEKAKQNGFDPIAIAKRIAEKKNLNKV